MSRYHIRTTASLEHFAADFATFIHDLLVFADARPGAYCELSLQETKAVGRVLETRDEVLHYRALSERTTLPPPASDEWDRRNNKDREENAHR